MIKNRFIMMLMAVLLPMAVNAQPSQIEKDLEAIKEDLKILQRQVYRNNQAAGISADMTPTPSVSASADVKAMSEYDEIIRQLNGKIDELTHQISQVEKRLDTINKDIDVRISLLEGKQIRGSGQVKEMPKKHDAPVATNAPKLITGGNIASTELKPLRTADKSVKEIYDTALDALHSEDLSTAKQNLISITEKYPNDTLTGNAYYWLGEVYYKQQDYKNAAITFANGYKGYKDSLKAPDNLFKLGMAMKALNKTEEACSAFVNLMKEFPKINSDLKSKTETAIKNLGCQQ